MRTGWLVCAVLVCACKGSAKESAAGQSFAEGMKLICDAPANDPVYFKTNLKNVDVVKLVGSIGGLAPAERVKRMRDAVAKAGLTSCAFIDAQAAAPFEHVPKVAAAPGASEVGDGPMLIATSTGIVVDGKALIAITNGQPDPAEIEGGAIGLVLPRVERFLAAMIQADAKRDPMQPLQLVIDPKLPYKLLIQVMFSAKKAGFVSFGIVVSAGGVTKSIPLVLPDRADPKHPDPTQPLGMMVALNNGKLLLWSTSGVEGTLQAPKTVTSPADLVKALDEIRTRRWTKAPRSDVDNQIIVMANATDSMQSVAEVLAVVRATPDGRDLFPRILLSTGFE